MIRGIIRVKTIDRDEETGVFKGKKVSVTAHPVGRADSTQSSGEGLKRAFDGWSNGVSGLDEFLDWNRQQRKVCRLEPGA